MLRTFRFWVLGACFDLFLIIVAGGWLMGIPLPTLAIVWGLLSLGIVSCFYLVWRVEEVELRKAGWKW